MEKVKEYENTHVYFDWQGVDSLLNARGILIGSYIFNENKEQKNSGTFHGEFLLYWYLDYFDIIHYDNLEGFSDNYRNNQFTGKWKNYNNGQEIICNWGESRIPDSGDLDVQAKAIMAQDPNIMIKVGKIINQIYTPGHNTRS